MTKNQSKRLLEYLKTGSTVNRIIAQKRLGIIELSARIVTLESDGHEIVKGWITLKNQFQEEYRLRTYKIV